MVLNINNKLIIILSIFCARGLCWSCYSRTCYYRSTRTMDWRTGISYCGQIYSTIASIHSYSENRYINYNVCGRSNRCWIGFNDMYSEGSYRWVDGTSVDYTRWDSGQPDDYNGEDVIEMYEDGTWNDASWGSSKYVICMKPAPTPSPTREPSYPWPTCQPTTLVPTTPPSAYPTTQSPTNGPTMLPTLRPTYLPSALPSLEPTYSPSVMPTFGPTHSPSHSPTFVPSRGPTVVPSIGPTPYPSVSPSKSPTSFPSDLPSLRPTNFPSVVPTFSPSVAPSSLPSFQPTTLSPTMYPSESPTFSPTSSPTYPIAQYCVERVKLHVAFLVVACCQIITICALCISILRRSRRGVVSPTILSPKKLRIERVRAKNEPEVLSMISTEKTAIEMTSVTGDVVEEIDMTPY